MPPKSAQSAEADATTRRIKSTDLKIGHYKTRGVRYNYFSKSRAMIMRWTSLVPS